MCPLEGEEAENVEDLSRLGRVLEFRSDGRLDKLGMVTANVR